ncbi:hypothetical protein [Streptomyces brasiliscabiei]|uniref:hypothetical protein n=1 Tax=Streptomyces brasiliscabiei TaxID=2736302 RepID=UPI0038F719A7
MATDRLTIPVKCPACHDIIGLPTATRYEHGRAVVAIDTGPAREHARQPHAELPDRCCGCVGEQCCNCGDTPCSTS